MLSTILQLPLSAVRPADIQQLQQKHPRAVLQIRDEPPGLPLGMTDETGWQWVARLDWQAEGDNGAVVEPLVAGLAAGPVAEIFYFQDWLSSKLFALDTRAHAGQIGDGSFEEGQYFSVDHFLYARACAVANGREAYEAALNDPSKMPEDLTFETLIHVAPRAYERKTGKFFEYAPVFGMETYSNGAGWPD